MDSYIINYVVMSYFIPKTASSQDIQRNYRALFDEVMATKEPLVVLNKNKPEVVVLDVNTFEKLLEEKRKFELEDTRRALVAAEKELKTGKTKKLKTLADLM